MKSKPHKYEDILVLTRENLHIESKFKSINNITLSDFILDDWFNKMCVAQIIIYVDNESLILKNRYGKIGIIKERKIDK